MMRATKAGALYALIVFPIGFALGASRLVLLAPALGGTAAVILEIPVMLVASWLACRWTVDRLGIRRNVPTRFLMGGVAVVVLMTAEFGLGWVLGRSPAERIANYESRSAAIGLTAQIACALFPVVQVWRR